MLGAYVIISRTELLKSLPREPVPEVWGFLPPDLTVLLVLALQRRPHTGGGTERVGGLTDTCQAVNPGWGRRQGRRIMG